ncbi:MAG: sulfite exporter TauE/SafE family protein [bacterium]|nr:sulfite exporter TauE/SafE family protein [bacterium]
MWTFVITGFILGLSSSLHCIGMCGPIAMALPLNRKSNGTILSGALQYNLGRTITYAILGVIAGSIGLTVHTFGFLQLASIFSGIFLILFAWRKLLSRVSFLHAPNFFFSTKLNSLLGKIVRSNSPGKLWLFGALNGLFPCGMVYAALLNSILAGSPMHSSMAMIAFGLGTLPAMLFVSFAIGKISKERQQTFRRALPYILSLVGVIVILRGMNLNIPYLSPRVSVQTEATSVDGENSTTQPKSEVVMDCCHSQDACEED